MLAFLGVREQPRKERKTDRERERERERGRGREGGREGGRRLRDPSGIIEYHLPLYSFLSLFFFARRWIQTRIGYP